MGQREPSWWLKDRPTPKPQTQKIVPTRTRVGGHLCTRQACAIQERVLCGHWSTRHTLQGLSSLGLADARNLAHWAPEPSTHTLSI